jgi:hypothetical protein
MSDLELAQQALPEPNITSVFGCQSWFENQLVSMYLAGMAKARELDAQQQEPAITLIGYQLQRLLGNPSVTEPFWNDWEDCSKEQYEHALATPDYQARALYASYDDSLGAQQQEPVALEDKFENPAKQDPIDTKRFANAPCYLCGYNGRGYYQPQNHPCAGKYHAAIDKK